MSDTPDLFDAAPERSPAVSSRKRARRPAREPAASASRNGGDYTAKDIEVLEGLEPVRRRPGMYIGGTDETALHHLAAEALDNAMDEAVAGFASRIEITLRKDGTIEIDDNGRGIPVDPHPKFKSKSALEVILTTLHSGAKFSDKLYATSGGLHGVGISVVNALADHLEVEVTRDRKLWAQSYIRGKPVSKLEDRGAVSNRRGTRIRFRPDPEIFGEKAGFRPGRLYRMARSKAYLFRGVEIRWRCEPELLAGQEEVPESAVLHFPGGLADFLAASLDGRPAVTARPFMGEADLPRGQGRVEWAISWPASGEDGFLRSYCNTIPTPDGGTHEAGLRAALSRGIKAFADLTGNRRGRDITADDLMGPAAAMLSLFLKDPQFQGQTKERLASNEAARLVESAIKDHFDHWLSAAPDEANSLLAFVLERTEERLRRRREREVGRKAATRKLRLPGKLADCARATAEGTEIFLVEGDSAGGSAKQARDRVSQAILPLRGKILNVASAGVGRMGQNQELMDLVQALGCGLGKQYRDEDLRYEKVIIMTDADVDGAHIAALLMTFFFTQMPALVEGGHLYLTQPPLYRLAQGGTVAYARDDAHRAELEATLFTGRGRIEVSRFKGLGEMPASQLKETAMAPGKRVLQRIVIPDAPAERADTAALVERLMGRRAEGRFSFIQENAAFATSLDI